MSIAITADGTTALGVVGAQHGGQGFYTLFVRGTFGGGTLKLYASPDLTSANAVEVIDSAMTVAGAYNIQVRAASLWLVMSGSTTPSLVVDVI